MSGRQPSGYVPLVLRATAWHRRGIQEASEGKEPRIADWLAAARERAKEK